MAFEVGAIQGVMLLDTDPFRYGLDQARRDAAAFVAEMPKARLTLDVGLFDAQLAETLAKMRSLADATPLRITADDAPLVATVLEAQTALDVWAKQLASVHLGATTAPFWADFGALRTEVGDTPITVPLDGRLSNLATLATQIGTLQAMRAGGATADVAAAVAADAASSGGSSTWTRLMALAGLGGGGTGGGGGLLAALGWGGGKGIAGVLGGMASFGSLLSLMGFGAEHVAATGVGVAGSLAGAGLGAGFLGLGALGTMGVGMGTDMAGIGQAANDVRKYQAAVTQARVAQSQYAATVKQFGANSAQAAAALQTLQSAQANVNATLLTMPKAARASIVALSTTLTQFRTMFDNATGLAEAKGAQILQSLVKVGERFIPTIGKFASENMSIISRALQPFEKWLDGPGLRIFTNLEKVFQAHLPTGMHLMEQAFELLAKTITEASHFMGPFLTMINRFVTRLNGATFGKWSHFVKDMITSFNDWFGLLTGGVNRAMSGFGGLIGFVVDLFKPAVGLGDDLANLLTSIFNQVDGWLVGDHTLLHGLFTAHAKELITGIGSIISAALPLVEDFASAFVQFATGSAMVATPVLRGIGDALRAIDRIPFAADIIGWGGALAFFGPRVVAGVASLVSLGGAGVSALAGIGNGTRVAISGFGSLLSAVRLAAGGMVDFALTTTATVVTAVSDFTAGIYLNMAALGEWIAGLGGVEIASVGLNAALGAAGVLGALAAVGVGIYELVTHWSAVASFFDRYKTVIVSSLAGITAGMAALDVAMGANPIGIVIEALAALGLAAYELYTHWDQIWTDVKSVVDGKAPGIVEDILAVWTGGLLPLAQHWSAVWGGIEAVTSDVASFFSGIWTTIRSDAVAAWNAIIGFLDGIPPRAVGAIVDLPAALVGIAAAAWREFLGATTSGWDAAAAFLASIPGRIEALFADAGTWLYDVGLHILEGLKNGVEAGIGSVLGAVKSVGSSIVSGLKNLLGISSPSRVMAATVGLPLMQGIAVGIGRGKGILVAAVQTAVAGALTAGTTAAAKQAQTLAEATVKQLGAAFANGKGTLSATLSSALTQAMAQLTTDIPSLTAKGATLAGDLATQLRVALLATLKTGRTGPLQTALTGVNAKLGTLAPKTTALATTANKATTAIATLATTAVVGLTKVVENLSTVIDQSITAYKALASQIQQTGVWLSNLDSNVANASAALAAFGHSGQGGATFTHNGPLVGQLVVHGGDTSNPEAVQAAVVRAMQPVFDGFVGTLTHLLGAQR